MSNTTVTISRTHLIYGVCLPLAVLLGYLLAEPFELGSIAVVAIVLGVLSIPLLMRWHHPLLLFSCNASVYFYFLPGKPLLWMLAAALSFGILLLNRTLGWDIRFFRARNVSKSLIFLAIVVLVTAYISGGVGLNAFGSRTIGSKRYLYIILAIFAYFGISAVTIPPRWAGLAVAVYFLSALTGLIGYVVALAGQPLYFLIELFPIEGAIEELNSPDLDLVSNSINRYGAFMNVALGLSCFLFARYGVRDLFDLRKPWRLGFFILTLVMSLLSGFRSSIIMISMSFGVLFYMEGLFRTRLFPILSLTAVLVLAALLPFTSKLPMAVQRSVAFLPVNVDPLARRDAEDSSEWRVQMWKEVLPSIPKYLIKGKGLAMTPADMDLVAQAQHFGMANSYEGSMLAGDYHSGPLSLIIPFGLFGVGTFVWFLWASLQALRNNYLYGEPFLRRINKYLFVFFIVRTIFFFTVFGSFYSDLIFFATLVGLGVSLNGGVAEPSNALLGAETE